MEFEPPLRFQGPWSRRQLPMERYSILDLTTSQATRKPEAVGRPLAWPTGDQLHFPGDDGGESLADWARRDLEATLQLLADRAQYITGASGAALALRNGQHILCRASSGAAAPEIGSCLEVSSGLSGESVRTRQALRCDDARVDGRVDYESCRRLGIVSLVVIPLLRNEEVIGIFEVFSGKPHCFGEHDVLALERMGEMVNTALDNAQKVCPHPQAELHTPLPPGKKLDVSVDQHWPTKPGNGMKKFAEHGQLASPAPSAGDEAAVSTMQHVLGSATAQSAMPDGPSLPTVQSSASADIRAIRKCSRCGFPVSQGRALCLDCEKYAPPGSPTGAAPISSDQPVLLAGFIAKEAEPPDLKQWIGAHKYLIGTVLVMGSTIALLLLR